MNKIRLIIIIAGVVIVSAAGFFTYHQFKNSVSKTEVASQFNTASTTLNESATSSHSIVIAKIPPYTGRPVAELIIDPNLEKQYTPVMLADLKKNLQTLVSEIHNNSYNPDLWRDLGILKSSINDYVGARDAFLYWHILSPGNSIPLNDLADLYAYHFNDKAKAEYYWKEALKLDHDPNYYTQLADLYKYFYKDNDKVIATITEGLKNNPSDLNLMLYLGAFYRDIGNAKLALTYYERVYQKQPRPDIKEEIDRLKAQIQMTNSK